MSQTTYFNFRNQMTHRVKTKIKIKIKIIIVFSKVVRYAQFLQNTAYT